MKLFTPWQRGGDVDHLARAHELHARAALRLAEAGLVRVDRAPALPGDELRALLREELLAALAGSASSGVLSLPASRSSRIRATVSVASFLLVPMTPDGPRLTQPTTYSPTSCSPLVAEHAPAEVGDQAAALVERDAGQRRAAVADRADAPGRRR